MSTALFEILKARAILLDGDGVVWSDVTLLRYFNELQSDFALQTGGYVKEAVQSVVSAPDPPEYSLPSDCVNANKVDCASWGNYRLDRATTAEMDRFDFNWQSTTASAASVYVTDRRAPKTLRLYPRPTTNDTLSYRYVAVPADVVLLSISALPTWVHHWLMFGIVGLASGDESELQDETKSQNFRSRYLEGIEFVKSMLGSIR